MYMSIYIEVNNACVLRVTLVFREETWSKTFKKVFNSKKYK